MNLLLIDSTYRYLKLLSVFNSQAKSIVGKCSGVEPALFVARPLVDWHDLDFRHRAVKGFIRFYKHNIIPLSNRDHGIRLHGLTDFAFFKSNKVHYTRSFDASVALLGEQIDLANKLAAIAKVDDVKHPSLFTIHLGQMLDDKEAELGVLVKALKEVLPMAKEKNVIIAMENMWSFNHKDYSFGSDLEDLAWVLDKVGDHPNLGLTFDFAHAMIHYRGDREKIFQLLKKNNLLKKIYHLHLTVPAGDYKSNLIKETEPSRFAWWQFFIFLLFSNPDNQGGFKDFFDKQKMKADDYFSWMKNIVQATPVIDKKYNCATLELGFKIPLTNSGARLADIDYSLDKFSSLF